MSQAASRLDAGAVSRMLAARVRELVREILPNGRLDRPGGAEWCVAGVHGAAPKVHGSCRVHLRGAKMGVWKDFATGEKGDALDLVAAVLFRGDRKAAFAWSLTWLGISRDAPPATIKAYVPEPSPAVRDAEDAKKRSNALQLWMAASPSLAGTPAAAYLKARGIDLARLGRQPRALRFHPACFCAEVQQRLPAMLGAISCMDGHTNAIHRTWLAEHGGIWGKARLKDAKKSLGTLRGGTIRLWRGASGKPLRDAPAGEVVGLGEGIETCLSVALAMPDMRVLCGVSLSNMANVQLPPQIGRVVLFGDNDGDNDGAARGLQRAIDHFSENFSDVRLARAPIGKDFNDCLRLQ
jgi:hypothetical protein